MGEKEKATLRSQKNNLIFIVTITPVIYFVMILSQFFRNNFAIILDKYYLLLRWLWKNAIVFSKSLKYVLLKSSRQRMI